MTTDAVVIFKLKHITEAQDGMAFQPYRPALFHVVMLRCTSTMYFRSHNELSFIRPKPVLSRYVAFCEINVDEWKTECEKLVFDANALPFSNAWIAGQVSDRVPEKSFLMLGILNSLRNWNFFAIPKGITCWSNTDGFGIDGILSTTIGAAIADPITIHYVVLGDLAFFYDLNSLGNRHVPKNIRIILVNNGRGVEFRNYRHPSAAFGEDADLYMAAAGHFGNQSTDLVRHYVTDLGFYYDSASTRENL